MHVVLPAPSRPQKTSKGAPVLELGRRVAHWHNWPLIRMLPRPSGSLNMKHEHMTCCVHRHRCSCFCPHSSPLICDVQYVGLDAVLPLSGCGCGWPPAAVHDELSIPVAACGHETEDWVWEQPATCSLSSWKRFLVPIISHLRVGIPFSSLALALALALVPLFLRKVP